jgi:predicted metal-dependent HD superfamily phosphohydrolase
MNDFKFRWRSLFPKHSDREQLVEAYELVMRHYAEPHRAYHTFEHISACLGHFDTIKDQLKNPLAIELAIWLHDVIYDPKAKDNEMKSAQLARELLCDTLLETDVIDQVCSLILLTEHPSTPKTLDEQYLLDIDLSILGSREDVYWKYEANVRQEYKSIPMFFYRRGRKKLLKSFLNEDHIYWTPQFHSLLEAQARINLVKAIDKL